LKAHRAEAAAAEAAKPKFHSPRLGLFAARFEGAAKSRESGGAMSFWGDVGNFISGAVNAVVGAVTTVVNAVVTTVESTVGAIVDAVDYVLEVFFSIPFLGRFLRELLSFIDTIVYGLMSLPDFILSLLGLRPEKLMRLCVIIQLDEEDKPITTNETVIPFIQFAIDTFKGQANVRILPDQPFTYTSSFSPPPRASAKYIVTTNMNSDPDTLDVNCDAAAWGADFTPAGSAFNMMMSRFDFWGNARRLLGYGAPVVAFAVRRFADGDWGCSLGPLADYVTVDFNDAAGDETDSTLAHELGHACSLWHVQNAGNLMIPAAPHPPKLTTFQISVLRTSRHVTYF
jgi:hypothetical protein